MGIIELILLGGAIAADSFAVSILIGIKETSNLKRFIFIATLFATFQCLMPVLGYLLITIFSTYLCMFDHYIAFFLLLYLGIKMIKSNDENSYNEFNLKDIIMLAIAVTIDAFAVGITYNILKVAIILPVIINFSITFLTTLIGIYIGKRLDNKIGKKANVLGGIILIIIGFKILLSHLNII